MFRLFTVVPVVMFASTINSLGARLLPDNAAIATETGEIGASSQTLRQCKSGSSGKSTAKGELTQAASPLSKGNCAARVRICVGIGIGRGP